MPVGFLYTFVIKVKSLLEDNEIWVSINANLCGPISIQLEIMMQAAEET